MSLCRQNFSEEAERVLNEQINMELTASYVYLSMATYFEREDVALPGLRKFFYNSSEEEREHAQKFISYVLARGGKVNYRSISAPESEWKSATNAVEAALNLEKSVNESLLKVHKLASDFDDANLTDFLEGNYLHEQVEAQKQLSDYLTQLRRVGNDGMGLYLWDRDLLERLEEA
eukprot:Clim_evm9s253 gene=Clim_evmTU9s253